LKQTAFLDTEEDFGGIHACMGKLTDKTECGMGICFRKLSYSIMKTE